MGLRRILYAILIAILSVSIAHPLTDETKKGDVIKGDFEMKK